MYIFICCVRVRVLFSGPSETVSVEQRLLSIPELSHHLAESYLTCCLFLQEMLQYKRQNHGKVCISYQSRKENSALRTRVYAVLGVILQSTVM